MLCLTDQRVKPPAVRDDLRATFETLWVGKKPKTCEAYQKDYRALAAFLNVQGWPLALDHVSRLSAPEANLLAIRWMQEMEGDGIAPATVSRRMSSLRFAAKRMRMLGLIVWSIEAEGPKVVKYRDTRGPGTDGFRKILAEAEDPRDRAILRLLWGLALRREEVCGLDLIHYDCGRLAVKRKGKADREWLDLPDGARAALDEWLAIRGGHHGPLFCGNKGTRLTPNGLYSIVRTLAAKAGLSRVVSPHRIRHAAITEAARHEEPLAVQRFAGHRSFYTTQRYIDDVAGEAVQVGNRIEEALE